MMKNNLATIFVVFFALTNCFSQDTITKKTGEIIKAKVSEAGVTEIKYKIFDNQNGPIYIINKSEVSAIRYENGTYDVFTAVKPLDTSQLTKPDIINYSDNCLKGRTDAEIYHGMQGLWFFSGFLFGGLGVIGAAVSSPSPNSKTLTKSGNKVLFDDAVYLRCYEKKARKKNVANAALGWVSWVLFLVVVTQ